MARCPCGLDASLAECCGRYHQGALAPTAEALMRSRYSAFALGLADYLARTTTEPTTVKEQSELAQWARSVTWLGLQVLDVADREVEFAARYLERDKLVTLRERSQFIQREGAWRYASGAPQLQSSKVGRNDQCPCGSGKKWKSCHA